MSLRSSRLLRTLRGYNFRRLRNHIIDDLRFYAEMNLTVKAIRVGLSAWDDLRNSFVPLLIEPGYSVADSFPKLLGIPVIALERGNPWARGYTFTETNASVFQLPVERVSDQWSNPKNLDKGDPQ